MSGITAALNTGISALRTHQAAIGVTSQNIANVNTPGYQRQRVNFREMSGPSGYKNPPVIGTGVNAKSIIRFATPFIDEQLRRQRGISGDAALTEDLLRDIESVLTEPSGTGINAGLDNLWKAWQNLSVLPVEDATRVALVQSANQLTASIKEAHSFIQNLHENMPSQISTKVQRINDIATEIADLNQQIIQANARNGGPGGAIPLEQRRDGLLFELSDVVDFRLITEESGLARVAIGNNALVDDSGARAVQLNPEGVPVWAANGRPLTIASGQLNALLHMKNEGIPRVLDQLNGLAVGLRDKVNEIHRTGFGIDGSTGLDFFVGEDAATLGVNPVLTATPAKIASGGVPNSIGDISVALQIAGLATQPVMGGDPPTTTINGFFRSAITNLGLRIRHTEANNTASEMVFNHLTDRRESISGVSMDEEVANLLSYEKAFQAGARIINAVDEMLDQVINRMGLVGR
ncbi:MAG: flagellar hook-associated protein FlgK [Caldilineaceae bacterium]|nr:flagellar hook-associated protein FlgK [Caldilineaceae bacterium]